MNSVIIIIIRYKIYTYLKVVLKFYVFVGCYGDIVSQLQVEPNGTLRRLGREREGGGGRGGGGGETLSRHCQTWIRHYPRGLGI